MNKINEYKIMNISVQGLNFNVDSSIYIYIYIHCSDKKFKKVV